MKKKIKNNPELVVVIIVIVSLYILGTIGTTTRSYHLNNGSKYKYSSKVFSIISSSENEVLDSKLKDFARSNKINIDIVYDDTLKITKRLNKGEKYDAVWLSNSIWMYTIDSNKVKINNTKSTSINPIVFGIKKSKAEELGFVGKDIYTNDIIQTVKSGNLKFSMSNPVTTNSGASAYLGILTTLAGNPEVLTSDMLKDEALKTKLKEFFTGVSRSSGDEDYLEEMFINGDYEAVFTYESSIININKKLIEKGKEPLYAIYPIDGVSISDSPIGYVDQQDEKKKAIYDKLLEYIIGKDGQNELAQVGRRTWYGGVTNKANKNVFNPAWGINTKSYISPLKYPSTQVIKEALALYQESLRKPVHVVFCLDYSGSMYGDGIDQLRDAMDFILTDRAVAETLQFNDEDIIEVIPFSTEAKEVWTATNAEERQALLENIKNKEPNGSTALYPATEKAAKLLRNTDMDKYNTSIIVMTDGAGNVGNYGSLQSYYEDNKIKIPIYSIKFASASERQLDLLAELSNGKIFDGSNDLVDAFTEVRGYN